MAMIAAAPKQVPEQNERNAGRALALGIAILLVVYIWLFLSGSRFFIMKTAVMPIFVLYGLLLNRRIAFLTDWLPLLTGTVLFDAMRGRRST